MRDSLLIKAPGTTITATLLALTVFFLVGCGSSAISAEPGQEASSGAGANPSLREVVLEISTIFCTGCWPRVEASAKSVPGVRDVKFDKQIIQRVIVIYDPAQTNPDAIVAAIESSGDKVTKVTES